MKIIFFGFTMLAFVSTLNAQINIDLCQEMARLNYPQIVQYSLMQQSKEYKISNVNKSFLPQISLNARATYQSDVTSIPISMPGVNITPMDKDQYNATIQLDQVIWDGGVNRSQKEQIKQSYEVEKKKLDVDIYQIRERVNQLYFGILLIEERLRQNKILTQEFERSYNQVLSFYDNGLANQSDLDAVQVEIITSRQKETELISNRVAYRDMLSIMIGKRIEDTIVLEKPSVINQNTPGFNNRPELEAFDAQRQLIEIQTEAINAKNRLKLGAYLQGGYGKPGMNMLNNKFDAFYQGGLRLSWNFGGLYTKKNERNQLKLNQQLVEVQKNTFVFNTNLKLAQQLINIEKLKNVMKDDDELISLRTSIKKSAETKVQNGTLSVTELMREMNKLDMVRQAKSTHEIEYLNAIYDYKNTMNN